MPKLKLLRGASQNTGVLLDAAGKLFRKKGFSATTVREIANGAGILPGSLHYRYRTKEAILLALMERGIAASIAAVRSAIAGSRDPIERLRLAMAAHFKVLVCGDDAIYVLLYEWRELRGDARDAMVRLRDSYDALWEGLLYQALGTGRLRPQTDIKLARLFILGAINWAPQWYSPEGDRTPEEIADIFADSLLLGLLDEGERTGPPARPRDPGSASGQH
jgi:AcrR family transcriptional regulator